MGNPLRSVAYLLALVAACSGKTTTTDGGTPSEGGSAGGANNANCPANDPGNGAACTKQDLICEYGDDLNPACNKVRTCSSGRWASPTFSRDDGTCPSALGGASDCAPSRSSVPEGQACQSKSTCQYDGATCVCAVACRNYPIRERSCDPDAGIVDNCCDESKIVWQCFDGIPFCSSPRPHLGSECSKDGAKCAVGSVGECGQATIECKEGTWHMNNVTCPVSTVRAKEDVAYVDHGTAADLHAQTMDVKLASYRYKPGHGDGGHHLGFIIEDMPPGSPAVLPSRERVDLYGYTSMAVAALQHQQREIDDLKAQLKALEKRCR